MPGSSEGRESEGREVAERLSGLRLRLRERVPLAQRTTLRIGGPARYFAEVDDAEALAAVLKTAADCGRPVLVLGKGSNILVPDSGFAGFVVVLTGDFQVPAIEGTRVRCGGGVALMSLALATRDAGLSGLENLSGIPSSFGGAVRINAGAYGSELFDVLESVTVVSRRGDERTVPASSIAHGYRWTALMERDDIVAAGVMGLRERPRQEIEARLREVTAKRRNALPKQPNAGSIFKNPPGAFAGRLLEECGLKGRRVGGAEVSAVHANVIVNMGGATADDVRALMGEMREAVRAKFGIELVPEIECLEERSETDQRIEVGSSP